MIKLSWKDLGTLHAKERNPKRTVWRVIGYGVTRKGREGYTSSQLQFMLQKNFKGFTEEQWDVAIAEMVIAGYVSYTKTKGASLYGLTPQGKELFDKKYLV